MAAPRVPITERYQQLRDAGDRRNVALNTLLREGYPFRELEDRILADGEGVSTAGFTGSGMVAEGTENID